MMQEEIEQKKINDLIFVTNAVILKCCHHQSHHRCEGEMSLLLLLCVLLTNARTYVSEPLDIVDGESLQFDVLRPKLENPVSLTRVVACSSVDAPYLPYDPQRSASTGCNSPGYVSVEIYSRDKSVSSKFAARLANGGRTMYLQKRLINVHTPVVHLDVHGIENTRHSPLAWHEHVTYVMERRYVPIGVKKKKPKAAEKSYWQQFKDKVSSVIYGKNQQDADEDEDEDDSDENDNYGRDHYMSYVMGHHWFVYSLLAMGVFAGIVLMVAIAAYGTARALHAFRQWRLARSMSYEDRHTREQQQKTRSALESATLKGMFVSSGGGGVKRDRSASRDPFGTHDEERDLIEQMFDTDL